MLSLYSADCTIAALKKGGRDFSALWNNARSAVHDAVHEKKLIKNCFERNLQKTKGDNKHEIK